MTYEDDVSKVGEISRQLVAIDIDDARAGGIAQRAREYRPSPRRFIEPVATAIVTCSYLAWALIRALEAFR